MERRCPVDVVLIGWPRSGSSSLFYWLDAHPKIVGSRPKETNFFFDQGHPLCGEHGYYLERDGVGAYEEFFTHEDRGEVRLDGSVHGFCQESGMDFFGSWGDPPWALAILRQPSERIYSAFRYTQGNLGGIDWGVSFRRYVEALLSGRVEELSSYYVSKASLWIARRELEFSRYVEWLTQWAGAIGRRRLMIVVLEEVEDRPLETMKEVCGRVGVRSSFYEEFRFGVRNESVYPVEERVHRVARRVGRRLPASRVKKVLKSVYERVQMSSGGEERSDGDKEALGWLDEYFEPWTERLERRFGLDLGRWRVER